MFKQILFSYNNGSHHGFDLFRPLLVGKTKPFCVLPRSIIRRLREDRKDKNDGVDSERAQMDREDEQTPPTGEGSWTY